MHLLYCDETNLDPKDHRFFVYGGLVIPCDNAKQLHDEIEEIRKKSSVPKEFSLKFNPKPSNMSHKEFTGVKQAVIEAAVRNKCIFLVSIILHQIATSADEARRNEINRVLFHFNSLLIRQDSYGLCLIDRFSDAQIDSHLREKFSVLPGFQWVAWSNLPSGRWHSLSHPRPSGRVKGVGEKANAGPAEGVTIPR